jgi:predicted TPR repeat methyltransferase
MPWFMNMAEGLMPNRKYTDFPLTRRNSNAYASTSPSRSLQNVTHFETDKQHLLLREITGKYPPLLAEVLVDDVPGEVKACLDIGCGSGGW